MAIDNDLKNQIEERRSNFRSKFSSKITFKNTVGMNRTAKLLPIHERQTIDWYKNTFDWAKSIIRKLPKD